MNSDRHFATVETTQAEQILRDQICRVQLLEGLKALEPAAADFFLRVFDHLSVSKGVDSTLESLLESGKRHTDAYTLAGEVCEIVTGLLKARRLADRDNTKHFYNALENFNVAVNAWVNQLCLRHSSQSVSAYRDLRYKAKMPSQN